MADKWIIVNKEYKTHDTLAQATAALKYVLKKSPDQNHRIIRIKTHVKAGTLRDKLEKSLRRCAAILWDMREHKLDWHEDYDEYLDAAVELLRKEDERRKAKPL